MQDGVFRTSLKKALKAVLNISHYGETAQCIVVYIGLYETYGAMKKFK